ncbi:MAG: YfcE family phosphodiesterase [Desulfobacteraceae bacterium]|nr:MAG: YfcE family phosphodiesterase [Desulfobacteraceae bacterium]
MPKLIISADVHGSVSTWITLKNLTDKDSGLAIAGDLFDTKYGSYGNPDYSPEHIRDELTRFSPPFFYVYGNCDTESFFPGADHRIEFTFNAVNILMHHGHRPMPSIPDHIHLIIEGHTHLPSLEKRDGVIFFNPGSLTASRSGLFTYGIMTDSKIALIDIRSNTELGSADLF